MSIGARRGSDGLDHGTEGLGRAKMLQPYIVYYRYKIPNEKSQGAVKQFRVYANDLDEARRMAVQHANYPNIELVTVKQA